MGRACLASASLVGHIETAKRMPSRDFSRRADEFLGTGGALERLWRDLVSHEAHPTFFRPFAEHEREAHTLRSWQPLIVDGLLQTPDYARALLEAQPGVTKEQVEESLTARLERQEILSREQPPLVWALMDERVLHRQVGSHRVMYEQLQALVEAAHHSHVKLQIVPVSSGAHPGVNGAFAIASFDGSSDVVYLESAGEGRVTDAAETVKAVTNAYDAIRTEALPVGASLDLITKVMKQWAP